MITSARVAEILRWVRPDELPDAFSAIDVLEHGEYMDSDEAATWRRMILAHAAFIDLGYSGKPSD